MFYADFSGFSPCFFPDSLCVAPHCWLIGWLTGLVVPQVAASYVHINVKELGSLWEKLRFDLVSGQAINFN